ncbi:MAG TPA: methylated-DNA--[protein]-cysteine S-methyltransferase [Longimicrobiales bacterium]|nr:methylated-DNA--[protein]-cysteine S-methyltransferase [Longimicrobiales bacterium]
MKTDYQKTDYQIIEAAISYLETNYAAQPELADVANHVHLSESHFQRVFKRWAGISPKRFLQYLTAEHARELLAGSSTVLDASYAVGLSGGGRLHDLMINVHGATPGEVKNGGAGIVIDYGVHESPFGAALIATTSRGICGLAFMTPDQADLPLDELRKRWPNALLQENIKTTQRVARAVFGDSGGQSMPAGSLSLFLKGTNFQIRVWEALLRIPAGRAVTYADIARDIGQPTASRAVGAAVGQNPIAYLIPCHRVLRKSGVFGDYHWGASRKKAILAWESGRNA